MAGTLVGTDRLRFMQAASNHEIEEIGVRTPITRPGGRARARARSAT